MVSIVFIVYIIAWFSLMRNLLFPGQKGTTNSSASKFLISSSIFMMSTRRLVDGQFHSACSACSNLRFSLMRRCSNQACHCCLVVMSCGDTMFIDCLCWRLLGWFPWGGNLSCCNGELRIADECSVCGVWSDPSATLSIVVNVVEEIAFAVMPDKVDEKTSADKQHRSE